MVGPMAPHGGRTSPLASTLSARARRWSLSAMLATMVNEAGVPNVLASTMLTLAAPAVATAFVYEVGSMRQAALRREAADRAQYAARPDAGTPPSRDEAGPAVPPKPVDWTGKLDAMLAARASILDLFGDDPSTVAPVYGRIIRQMLRDDEATFASLTENRSDEAADRAALADREARLREIHGKLARLAGA